ncbi:MAG: AAA family ATPase [Cetobacterium sp.]
MVIMHLKIDNLFAFKNFDINFSYPKKLVDSSIDNEYLKSKPNFRYKKFIALMGANATGKTSIGKALVGIFNFISKKETAYITKYICNKQKSAKFSIDFLTNEETLYRIDSEFILKDDIYITKLKAFSTAIAKKDSYETCIKKLKEITYEKNEEIPEYQQKLEMIPNFGWLFTFPEVDSKEKAPLLIYQKAQVELDIFNKILKTLDPSIKKVGKLPIPNNNKETENKTSYYIEVENQESILIQNGEILDSKKILSSGTRDGIEISYLINALCKKTNGFYFCDEKFSYIQSDIEIALINLMIELLEPCAQLFITTHNLDILDRAFPKHSFTFLKKEGNQIKAIYPSDYLKKNDRALRNAIRNDIFEIAPDIDSIHSLMDLCQNKLRGKNE